MSERFQFVWWGLSRWRFGFCRWEGSLRFISSLSALRSRIRTLTEEARLNRDDVNAILSWCGDYPPEELPEATYKKLMAGLNR